MCTDLRVLSILPPRTFLPGGLAILRMGSAGNCMAKAVWPVPPLPGCSALRPLHPAAHPSTGPSASSNPSRGSASTRGRLMNTPAPAKWVLVGCSEDWHCAIILVVPGFHCKLGRRRQKTDKNTGVPQPQKVPFWHEESHRKLKGGRNMARVASPLVQPWHRSCVCPTEVLLQEWKEKLALQRGQRAGDLPAPGHGLSPEGRGTCLLGGGLSPQARAW